MARRLKAHRTGKGGAKYTKSHGGAAVRLAYAESCADKSAALKREAAMKKLPKAEKEALAAKWAADNRITMRMATPADGAAVARAVQLVRAATAPRPSSTGCPRPRSTRANIAGVLEKAPFLVAITPDGRLAGLRLRPPLAQPRGLCLECGGYRLLRAGLRRPGRWASACTRALLELLRMQGYYNAFAIVTGENKASHEFHKRMGFTKSFVEKHSGYKFGRWLDVVYWQYPLRTGDAPPEPVRYRLTEAEMVSILEKVNL